MLETLLEEYLPPDDVDRVAPVLRQARRRLLATPRPDWPGRQPSNMMGVFGSVDELKLMALANCWPLPAPVLAWLFREPDLAARRRKRQRRRRQRRFLKDFHRLVWPLLRELWKENQHVHEREPFPERPGPQDGGRADRPRPAPAAAGDFGFRQSE